MGTMATFMLTLLLLVASMKIFMVHAMKDECNDAMILCHSDSEQEIEDNNNQRLNCIGDYLGASAKQSVVYENISNHAESSDSEEVEEMNHLKVDEINVKQESYGQNFGKQSVVLRKKKNMIHDEYIDLSNEGKHGTITMYKDANTNILWDANTIYKDLKKKFQKNDMNYNSLHSEQKDNDEKEKRSTYLKNSEESQSGLPEDNVSDNTSTSRKLKVSKKFQQIFNSILDLEECTLDPKRKVNIKKNFRDAIYTEKPTNKKSGHKKDTNMSDEYVPHANEYNLDEDTGCIDLSCYDKVDGNMSNDEYVPNANEYSSDENTVNIDPEHSVSDIQDAYLNEEHIGVYYDKASKIVKKFTSKYDGVVYNKYKNNYESCFKRNGKHYYLCSNVNEETCAEKLRDIVKKYIMQGKEINPNFGKLRKSIYGINEINRIDEINKKFKHLTNEEKGHIYNSISYIPSTKRFRCKYWNKNKKREVLVSIKLDFGTCVLDAQKQRNENSEIPSYVATLINNKNDHYHKRKVLNIEEEFSLQDENANPNSGKLREENVRCCEICKQVLSSPFSLKRHRQIHTTENPYHNAQNYSSKYLGVTYDKNNNNFRGRFRKKGKSYYLCSDVEEETCAEKLRDIVEKELAQGKNIDPNLGKLKSSNFMVAVGKFGNVQIYKGPRYDYAKIGKLVIGEIIEVIEIVNGWVHHKKGWSSQHLLKPRASKQTQEFYEGQQVKVRDKNGVIISLDPLKIEVDGSFRNYIEDEIEPISTEVIVKEILAYKKEFGKEKWKVLWFDDGVTWEPRSSFIANGTTCIAFQEFEAKRTKNQNQQNQKINDNNSIPRLLRSAKKNSNINEKKIDFDSTNINQIAEQIEELKKANSLKREIIEDIKGSQDLKRKRNNKLQSKDLKIIAEKKSASQVVKIAIKKPTKKKIPEEGDAVGILKTFQSHNGIQLHETDIINITTDIIGSYFWGQVKNTGDCVQVLQSDYDKLTIIGKAVANIDND